MYKHAAGVGIVIAFGATLMGTASASTHPVPLVEQHRTVEAFWCNDDGDCISPAPGKTPTVNELLEQVAYSSGHAWKWTNDVVGTVTIVGPFTDHTIDHDATGLAYFGLELSAEIGTGDFCGNNRAGSTDLVHCAEQFAAEQWVYYNRNGHRWLVNVGRSNDKGTWEVLCGDLITTRNACGSVQAESWTYVS